MRKGHLGRARPPARGAARDHGSYYAGSHRRKADRAGGASVVVGIVSAPDLVHRDCGLRLRREVWIMHLGRWLERNALAVDQLTAGAVTSFLAGIGTIAGGCRERAGGHCLSICARSVPFRPSRALWWRRLSDCSASTASGFFASADWRRSRSSPASSSPAGSSVDASARETPVACWGSRAARSTRSCCASARG